MSEEMDTLVENIRQPSVWIRIVFMVGFAVVLYAILLPIIIVLAIVQALFSVFAGESNENLRYFAVALEQYVSQIIKFLTYNSESKPFPFSDFPQLGDDTSISEADHRDRKSSASAKQKQAATRKSTAKKSTEKKATSKKSPSKKTTAKKKSARKAGAKNSEPENENNDLSESA